MKGEAVSWRVAGMEAFWTETDLTQPSRPEEKWPRVKSSVEWGGAAPPEKKS